jgi:hypothetical protein
MSALGSAPAVRRDVDLMHGGKPPRHDFSPSALQNDGNLLTKTVRKIGRSDQLDDNK